MRISIPNDADRRAHYQNGTADEIWRQTEGRVTHFVATIGAPFTRSESPVEADSIELRAEGSGDTMPRGLKR